MSDIELYLFEADKNKMEAQRVATQSAGRLEAKTLKLIDLITSLEPYINDKDDGSIRAKSVTYLADVLSSLPPRVLSGQERRLLCDFILGRIEGDAEGIGASARALIALEGLGKWDADTVQKVLRTFIDNTHPLRQFKLQTERYALVQLIDLLLAKYRDALRQLHESDHEFMTGFISYFEGEKDPRNLMIIFSLLQVPMTEWDIHACAQDLFDSVFNYFPITFKPPPDDPYGITAQDLKDRLRDCIAANSDFAPYAFPQLLDKLDSTSMNTKRDVLHTIQACVLGYEAKTINLYSVTLWDALKFEILNVQEEDLALESLKALGLIAAKFAETAEGPLNAYLRPVIKECNEHLEDAPTKQSEATGRILHALAVSGPAVADKISKGVLPVLFSLYNGSQSITKRRGLLDVFNHIVAAYVELDELQPNTNTEALQAYANDALEAMIRALVNAPKAEVSFRLASLKGLTQLVSTRNALSEKEGERAVDTITDMVLHEQFEGHGDIRAQAIKALTDVAHSIPLVVRDRSVPAFMVELLDNPSEGSVLAPVLEAFAQLSTERQIFDTIALRLKNKYGVARHQGAPQQYQRSLLLALLYAFTFGAPMREDGIIRSAYYTEYAEPLLTDIASRPAAEQDHSTLDIVGRIVNVLLRPQGVHFQSTVYNKNLQWLSSAGKDEMLAMALAPFTLQYYAGMKAEVADAEDIVSVLKAQAHLALHASSDPVGVSTVLRHLSLLVNKFINPKTMQATLEASGIEVGVLLSATASSQAIGAAFAVVKGLLIQGKSGALATRYLQALLDILASEGKDVARHFATLLAPDDILSKENHCLVSGLYKQKIFNQSVPFMIDAVRTADASIKPNYLIALSGILRWLPYSVIEPSLKSLIAPLLQTLDLNEPAEQEVKASALIIFESLLMHDPTIVAEHTASLVTRLLNSTAGPANKADVRAKALQCLALAPRQLKREAVVPYRRQVVKRLQACLDDTKRSVRTEAVKCRTAWLGLDEGNEDEE
ncbi:hypothetical protein LTR36_002657 [Oleoguttula mirabilis]|uniref:MMS19 nucleotide excision repair protein n=1 Tax=Oleoguttula mirabilis TaxID=1507867 RepID=A0AAV9JL36_9PEZI|nr:hypothetical protein LTR36_002657 [Oleoguttula mirabilis]